MFAEFDGMFADIDGMFAVDGMFAEITDDDDLKTRYNDYNYVNKPSVKKYLEQFPSKKTVV